VVLTANYISEKLHINGRNTVVEWLTLLRCVREVTGLIPGSEVRCFNSGFSWCPPISVLKFSVNTLIYIPEHSFHLKIIIFWDVTPCSLLSCKRRFGGTYRLHLQGRRNNFSRNQQVSRWKIISSTLKMEAICSSETSVTNQETTRRHIPEDDTLPNHRCENLKSYSFHLIIYVYLLFIAITGTRLTYEAVE
jgi:hypothetical protein